MFGLLSTTAKSSMRPPMTAGPISRNSRFLNLSVGLWGSGAARASTAVAPTSATPATIVRSVLDVSFISVSSSARPGILPLSRVLRSKCFWKGQPTLSRQTRGSRIAFQACVAAIGLWRSFRSSNSAAVLTFKTLRVHARLSFRYPSHGLRESSILGTGSWCDLPFLPADDTSRDGFELLPSYRSSATGAPVRREGSVCETGSQDANAKRRCHQRRWRRGHTLRRYTVARRSCRIQRKNQGSGSHRPRSIGLQRRAPRSERSALQRQSRPRAWSECSRHFQNRAPAQRSSFADG